MGNLHACHRTCLEALAVAEDFEKQSKRQLSATGQIYSLMARNLAEWGEFEKALQVARKGLQLSEQWGLPVAITGSLDFLGRILVFCQELEQARQIINRSDDACSENISSLLARNRFV